MSGKAKYGPSNPSAIRRASRQRAKDASTEYPSTIFLRAVPPDTLYEIGHYGSGNPSSGVHVHFYGGDPERVFVTTVGGKLYFAHTDAEEAEVLQHLRRGDLHAARAAATATTR